MLNHATKFFLATVLIALFGFGLSGQAPAASFDCAKATTAIEKQICTDPQLSRLNEQLTAAYREALRVSTEKETVKHDQQEWLANTRGACHDRQCLVAAYTDRLAQFSQSRKDGTGSGFTGQWHMELCDKKVADQCGGFTVYLVQAGTKLCGDHFFAAPGLGRLNEGSPRSVIGVVTNNVADIQITSGRTGAVFRARALRSGDVLDWKVLEEIKRGPEGESSLILENGNLKREAEDSKYQATLAACSAK